MFSCVRSLVAGGAAFPLWQEFVADPPHDSRGGPSADWAEEQVCQSRSATSKSAVSGAA